MRSQRSWALPILLFLGAFVVVNALLAPGCGVSSASSDTVKVWGRVTYRGKPVPGGAVIFVPTESTQTNWGVGPIDEKGSFRISTYMTSGGLQPGPYRIFLTPPRVTPGQLGSVPNDRNEVEKAPAPPDAGQPKFGVPERFQRPQSSGLMVNLEKEGNRIDIELRD